MVTFSEICRQILSDMSMPNAIRSSGASGNFSLLKMIVEEHVRKFEAFLTTHKYQFLVLSSA